MLLRKNLFKKMAKSEFITCQAQGGMIKAAGGLRVLLTQLTTEHEICGKALKCNPSTNNFNV